MVAELTRHRVAVVGASGYAGGETLRLLAGHPALAVTTVTAHSSAGRTIEEAAPHIDLDADLVLQETTPDVLSGHDVVILALPHGKSGELAAELRATDPDVLVVDLGADHRLERAADWEEYYGSEHSGTWTYGMPELPLAPGAAVGSAVAGGAAAGSADTEGASGAPGGDATHQRDLLREATEIAVPGCNASAVTFPLVPLVRAELVDPGALQTVLPVGYTGAGRTPKQHLMFSEAAGGATPYGVGGTHRHIPEILQNIRRASGVEDARLTFTPVLVPMSRGILAVTTAPAGDGVGEDEVLGALHEHYDTEHFVSVLPAGAFPSTSQVSGANTVRIGATVDHRTGQVTVISAIDNLVKGTAGAAIQSVNVALGLPEETGLSRTAHTP